MKKNITLSFLLLLSLLLFAASCSTTEPPIIPPPDDIIANTIILTIEWTDLYSIKLNWNKAKADTTTEHFIYLLTQTDEQGSKTTKQFTIAGKDTSYIAGETDSLVMGKTYKFVVEAYDEENKLKDTSKTVTAKTLLPTSHNISWQIDTLGQPGNFLYDVWGLDENNVWAIGAVNMPEGITSLIKWDGFKWNYHSWPEGGARGIWGFSTNDIWTVGDYSNRGFIGHFDGTIWTEYRNDYFLARGDTVYPLYSVWGSSSDDVWAVGDKGTIIHWNGNEWQKVDAGIATRITAIWGTSQNKIYIVPISGIRSSLYKFDGSLWNKIFDDIAIYSTTLWSAKSGNLIIGGTSLLEYDGSILRSINIAGRTRGIVKVRGSNINNIFTAGDFGEITHFDGLTWQDISDFEVPYGRYRVLHSVWCTENKVFIVGEDENRAIVITGTIH